MLGAAETTPSLVLPSQAALHMRLHAPGHYLSTEQANDGGQVQPALIGGGVDDVSRPNLMGRSRGEVALQQVRGDGQIMLAVSGEVQISQLKGRNSNQDEPNRRLIAKIEAVAQAVLSACAVHQTKLPARTAPSTLAKLYDPTTMPANLAKAHAALDKAVDATYKADVMKLVDKHQLYGRGIGYVDSHLLTSAVLRRGTQLWTRDQRLLAAARQLAIAF